jgi:2-aminoethylphosphonate-pyruvate transaminase
LLAVYGLPASDWGTTLLTGSGTAAVEAMITSLVPHDGRLLVAENGVYGERISRIAAAYGIATTRVATSWGGQLDLKAIAEALRSKPHSHVAVVHHETTTGRLNDLASLAALCGEAQVEILLDGVSSFGAEQLDFAAWHIDACAATANKCLHGVPGTAFVIVRRAALAQSQVTRSVYFDLREYLARQDEQGTPFTQSVQTFYALDAALDEFFEAGGWPARQTLFQQRMAIIRTTLETLGVRTLLSAQDTSCVLQAFELPDGRTYQALHDALKARGFIIYAGQGGLSKRVFRISAMGAISDDDLARLCRALREILG